MKTERRRLHKAAMKTLIPTAMASIDEESEVKLKTIHDERQRQPTYRTIGRTR